MKCFSVHRAELRCDALNLRCALGKGEKYDTVKTLGDELCIDATRALTLKVCGDLIEGDDVSQRISQKQLASALLKWVLLRDKL